MTDERIARFEELVAEVNGIVKEYAAKYMDVETIGGLSDDELKLLKNCSALYAKCIAVSRDEIKTLVSIDEKLDILTKKIEKLEEK